MEFDEAALVRLADPATRSTVFNEAALLSVLHTVYRADDIVGPCTAVFDLIEMGYRIEKPQQFTGVALSSQGARFELQLSAEAPERRSPLDALWVGAVAAKASAANDPIVAVQSTAVPVPPEATPISLGSELRVTFAEPHPLPDVPVRLPVVAAILARPPGYDLRDLLVEARLSRAGVVAAGTVVAADSSLPPVRHRAISIWITPSTTFDDAHWPGGESGTPAQRRAARLARATSWMAEQGIAITTLEPT